MNITRKPKTMTLKEWEAKQAKEGRQAARAELADCAVRQAESRVWDDPRTWK